MSYQESDGSIALPEMRADGDGTFKGTAQELEPDGTSLMTAVAVPLPILVSGSPIQPDAPTGTLAPAAGPAVGGGITVNAPRVPETSVAVGGTVPPAAPAAALRTEPDTGAAGVETERLRDGALCLTLPWWILLVIAAALFVVLPDRKE